MAKILKFCNKKNAIYDFYRSRLINFFTHNFRDIVDAKPSFIANVMYLLPNILIDESNFYSPFMNKIEENINEFNARDMFFLSNSFSRLNENINEDFKYTKDKLLKEIVKNFQFFSEFHRENLMNSSIMKMNPRIDDTIKTYNLSCSGKEFSARFDTKYGFVLMQSISNNFSILLYNYEKDYNKSFQIFNRLIKNFPAKSFFVECFNPNLQFPDMLFNNSNSLFSPESNTKSVEEFKQENSKAEKSGLKNNNYVINSSNLVNFKELLKPHFEIVNQNVYLSLNSELKEDKIKHNFLSDLIKLVDLYPYSNFHLCDLEPYDITAILSNEIQLNQNNFRNKLINQQIFLNYLTICITLKKYIDEKCPGCTRSSLNLCPIIFPTVNESGIYKFHEREKKMAQFIYNFLLNHTNEETIIVLLSESQAPKIAEYIVDLCHSSKELYTIPKIAKDPKSLSLALTLQGINFSDFAEISDKSNLRLISENLISDFKNLGYSAFIEDVREIPFLKDYKHSDNEKCIPLINLKNIVNKFQLQKKEFNQIFRVPPFQFN